MVVGVTDEYRKVEFRIIDDEAVVLNGIAVVVVLNTENERELRIVTLDDATPWDRLGWLTTALAVQQKKLFSGS